MSLSSPSPPPAHTRELRLTHRGLRSFPREVFAHADTLEVLDLSGNLLDSLPEDLPRLHRLRILFASHNPFTQLPSVLGRMPRLEMVGFKACRIAEVPPDSLPAQLRWLILTDNQITALPDSFGDCHRLQKLMLSCNQLQALPASLARCIQLELLRLASNRFTEVPAVVLQLPQLAWLALAGNPLTQKSEQQSIQAPGHPAISYQNLALHEVLGEGASGRIVRATLRSTGEAVALKLFKAAHTSDGTPQSEMAAGWAAGQHDQLLTPLAPVTDEPDGLPAMTLPLLPAGLQPLAQPPSFASCTRDVYAEGMRWKPAAAQRMLAHVRSAVAHLHVRGVLHGDLYAHNILWNPQTGDCQLSDLGAALLTAELPPATVQQLQQQELRALQHLHDEVLARCATPAAVVNTAAA
jgi:hypothetical protein